MTNQYIITEEMACWVESKFNEGDEITILRSRPYQSERDKVRDNLLEAFDDDGNYSGWFIRQVIEAELRQKAGE